MNAGLTQVIEAIVTNAKSLVAAGLRLTVLFDRGGWSLKLFARLHAMDVDIITYRKGKHQPVPQSRFTTPTGTAVTFHRASHGRGRPRKDVLAVRSAMRSRGPVTAASAPGGRRTRVPVAEASDGVTRRWSADGDRDEPE